MRELSSDSETEGVKLRHDPSREKAVQQSPQALLNCNYKNNFFR